MRDLGNNELPPGGRRGLGQPNCLGSGIVRLLLEHTLSALIGYHARASTVACAYFCMQIINLGCGMDTRPWRLNIPTGLHEKISWIDVDTQEMIDLKRKLIHEEVVSPAASAIQVSLGIRNIKAIRLHFR